MNQKKIHKGFLIAIALMGVITIMWWLNTDPTDELRVSLPGADNRGKGVVIDENIQIGEHFQEFTSVYLKLSEKWSRFRGSNFDNISETKAKLIQQFPASGPNIKWSIDLGEGHSGVAIWEGLAYLLDYDEDARSDVLRCLSLTDGTELWNRSYNVAIKRNHGMSRTVPAITEDYIVTMGPRCHVMCVDRESGDFRWGIDIAENYRSEVPFWYTGQCPLIDNNKAIIATGGDALMIAVDCISGEILWTTPNPKGWKMSHSSVMPFEFEGQEMYVYSAIGGLVGISAEGENEGQIIWENKDWNHSVVAPSPVCMPDGKIFLTAGYGAGSMMVQLSKENDTFKVEVLDEYTPKEGLACEQQTPVFFQGHLFGVLPKDAGALRNQFVCVHPDRPREIVWSSGKDARFGLGPYFIADNKFYLLSDAAELTIIDPSISIYKQLGQATIIEDGHDAWAPLATADGYLVLRDSKKMVCIDMKE